MGTDNPSFAIRHWNTIYYLDFLYENFEGYLYRA